MAATTVDELLAQLENVADFVRSHTPKVPSRQAEVVERARRMIDWVSQIRMGRIVDFGLSGDIQFDGPSSAAGLLEVFYLVPGPKTVRTSVTAYDWASAAFTHVNVDWQADRGRKVTAVAVFTSDKARQLVESCKAPSVHLLRQLQIAGVS
jgi:hypothetical protein